ncbi:MAG: redox-sensing transcriptional repressor Rex [Chloroflexota bacterium]|nr:redox-sensing transcriptional repressor Rex [Chloroflexota bacterium]
MVSKDVPDIVVGRLPLYLRALSFQAAEGREVISSQELGHKLGISPAQIRKDLSHFGEFGKQGTGYDVQYLSEQLLRILKVNEEREVALIGAGDLGRALVHYDGFADKGFRISLVFDNNSQKIGQRLGLFEILDSESIETIIPDKGIEVAIVAVPANAAQEVVDALVRAGVKAILNYAPITVKVPKDLQVQYIDPVIHLQHMAYYL